MMKIKQAMSKTKHPKTIFSLRALTKLLRYIPISSPPRATAVNPVKKDHSTVRVMASPKKNPIKALKAIIARSPNSRFHVNPGQIDQSRNNQKASAHTNQTCQSANKRALYKDERYI
jgi:hypothetical protein